MGGFSGASGVPKKYVDDLVSQSTAIPQTALQNWRSYTSFESALAANIAALLPNTGKAYMISGIINGGAMLAFTFTRNGTYIEGLDSRGARWTSSNTGATWTVTQPTAYSYARYENNTTTCVYKFGRVCFITCVVGSWYNSGAGAILRLGSASANGWLIPVGFRPVENCEIKEALNDKRITVDTNGNVTCNEALSGVALRFSGCYICAE